MSLGSRKVVSILLNSVAPEVPVLVGRKFRDFLVPVPAKFVVPAQQYSAT